MKIVGITGGIASGKSTVSLYLQDKFGYSNTEASVYTGSMLIFTGIATLIVQLGIIKNISLIDM